MLDIRTLLLLTPEDRYEPNLALRSAELVVYPLLRPAMRIVPGRPAAQRQEVLA